MSVKAINKELCGKCSWRIKRGCLVIDSCPTDVLRADDAGYPKVTYPDDCMNCFMCEKDCPKGAIEISPVADFQLLAY